MHSPNEDTTKIQKRVFIGLLVVSIALILGIIVAGILIYYNKIGNWYRYALLFILAVLALLTVAVIIGIAGVVMTLWHIKGFFGFKGLMNTSIRILFPLVEVIGEILHIPKDIIKSSFIEVNNKLTESRKFNLPPDKILILAPHCIQWWNCPYKVTADATNCRHCGRCDVDKLLELAQGRGVHLAIVTGGTLARNMVNSLKPKAIIAIACERDLTEGILDTNPLPVVGVLNVRPEGPCKNTGADINLVSDAIDFFVGRKESMEFAKPKRSSSQHTSKN